MYIRSVHICNYRNFFDIKTELKQTSIIIGENETGKSNFLSALSLPLSDNELSYGNKRLKVSDINISSIQTLYQRILEKAPLETIQKCIPIVSVEVELTSPEDNYEEAILSKWLCDTPDGQTYKLKYEFYPRDRSALLSAVRTILDNTDSISDTQWFTYPIEHYDYRIVSTNNDRQVNLSDLKNVVINHIQAERDDFSENSTARANNLLTRLLTTTLNEQEKATINRAYKDFFKQIEETDTFSKIVNFEPDFENFSKHIDDLECIPNLPNLRSILSNITLKSGSDFLHQRGLGRRNLVYIILLFQFFQLNRKTFNLCCIEEPESHLSVNNLHLATDFLHKSASKKNTLLQTIITTHSPWVINKLEISNVIIFTPKRTIPLFSAPTRLQTYLSKRPNFDILNLLFSNSVILVEGTTEEMLINSFLQKTGDSIHDTIVLSIGQKGFRTFLDIWLLLNKDNKTRKIGVIRDFDNQTTAKLEHDKYDTNHENVIVRTTSGYTLEDDLTSYGNNIQFIVSALGLSAAANAATVSEHMKSQKAEAMLGLCNAFLMEDQNLEFLLPKHIQEVIDFMK